MKLIKACYWSQLNQSLLKLIAANFVWKLFQRVILNIINFSRDSALLGAGLTPLIKSITRPEWFHLINLTSEIFFELTGTVQVSWKSFDVVWHIEISFEILLWDFLDSLSGFLEYPLIGKGYRRRKCFTINHHSTTKGTSWVLLSILIWKRTSTRLLSPILTPTPSCNSIWVWLRSTSHPTSSGRLSARAL